MCNVCRVYVFTTVVPGAHEPPEGSQGASNYVQRHLILSGSDTFLIWTFPQVGNLTLWSLRIQTQRTACRRAPSAFCTRDANSRIVNITRGPRIYDGARARR